MLKVTVITYIYRYVYFMDGD